MVAARCGQKFVVVDGLQRGGLETTREGGAGAGSGHLSEFRQSGQVDRDRKSPSDLQPAGDLERLLVGQRVPQRD